MEINLNDTKTKKIGGVELIGLNSKCYGPKGKHTRQEWRDECLHHFENGQNVFEKWQESWINDIDLNLRSVNFGGTIKYEDGTTEQILEGIFFNTSSAYSLDFVGQEFLSLTDATNYNFLQGAHFNAATFKHVMKFRNSTFNKWVDFSSAVFDDHSYAEFNDTNFLGFARFANVRFGYADFKNTKFKNVVIFENSIFSGQANFTEQTEFQNEVNFKRVLFKKDANFYNSIFLNNANFNSTVFKRDADFRNTTFTNKANFFKSKFLSQCRFDYDPERVPRLGELTKEVKFLDEVNFENVDIQNVGHFERAYFVKKIPNFLGVDNSKTLLIFSGDECFNKDDTSGNATDRIAQLKRLSEEQGQTDQMLMFNAFELNAKAKQTNAGWGIKTVTGIYDYFSDFGRSFLRPLGLYVLLLFLTFMIALEHSAQNAPRNYMQLGCEKYIWWIERVTWIDDKNCLENSNELKLTGIRAASEYTLYRAAGVLDFADDDKQTKEVAQRLFGQKIEPWWMRIWGVFKAIASTALLFLAALGLRNKYRIK